MPRCLKCDKHFGSQEKLDAHVMRGHIDPIEELKEVVTEEEKPKKKRRILKDEEE